MLSSRARLSIPDPIVALPCGSRSTTSVRRPSLASPAARLTVVVVLPTPPFWLAMQKMRIMLAGARFSWKYALAPAMWANPHDAAVRVQSRDDHGFDLDVDPGEGADLLLGSLA